MPRVLWGGAVSVARPLSPPPSRAAS